MSEETKEQAVEPKTEDQATPEAKKEEAPKKGRKWNVGMYNVVTGPKGQEQLIAQMAVFLDASAYVVSLAGLPSRTMWPNVGMFCMANEKADVVIVDMNGKQVWPETSAIAVPADPNRSKGGIILPGPGGN